MKRMVFHVALAAAVLALFLSCGVRDKYDAPVELGCVVDGVEVSADKGTCGFDILSSGDCIAALEGEPAWIRVVSGNAFTGDGRVELEYDVNRGGVRKAELKVTCGGYDLILSVVQEGLLDDRLEFENASLFVSSDNGTYEARIETLSDLREAVAEVKYGDEGGWIDEAAMKIDGVMLRFSIGANASSERRHAVISISLADGDGNVWKTSLRIVQRSAEEDEPEEITVAGLRSLPAGEITDNLLLVARASSDDSEGNGGQDMNFSAITQDLGLSARTVYLQSLEKDAGGRYYGVRVETVSEEDNIVSRYDKVGISLKGLVLSVEGGDGTDEPVRYSIRGVTADDIVMTESGNRSEMPQIIRTLASLTDDDIYTFVTVPDCQIPVRKGPFVPVHLQHRTGINKYPMPLLDVHGSTMYMLTNTTAAWARDGKGLPQGCGSVSGVVVHEKCDNFEWDTEKAAVAAAYVNEDYVTDIGYIGPYQIRPVSREDIALTQDFEDASNFSSLICEWRYFNERYPDAYIPNVKDGVVYSTWPYVDDPTAEGAVNGRITYTALGETANVKLLSMTDWSHLGPVENNRIVDIPGSFGVRDAAGADAHWSPYSDIARTGVIGSVNGSAFKASYWYDTGNSHKNPRLDEYCWQMEFSTLEYSSVNAPMSIQLGTVNGDGTSLGAPRYWVLEYSADGQTWQTLTASSYVGEDFVDLTGKMGNFKGADYTYSVPDFPLQAERKVYNCPGHKYMSFTLPSGADVWGKDKVYVRFHAAADVSGYDKSYDSDDICNNRCNNITYAAVRCNR